MHPSVSNDAVLGFVVQQSGFYDINVETVNASNNTYNGQMLYLQLLSDVNQDYTDGFLEFEVYNPHFGSQHFTHNDIYLAEGDLVLLRVNARDNQNSDTTRILDFSLTTNVAVVPEPLSVILLTISLVCGWYKKRIDF